MGVGVTVMREFTVLDKASPQVVDLLEEHQVDDLQAVLVCWDRRIMPRKLLHGLRRLAEQGDESAQFLLQELKRTGAINVVLIYD